ncbi:MAG TPA: glycosyltransferase family 4 protein [Rhodoblastus sp.]|nr:glycosyltransferase family 4 protein [Rhodoblastus sp.]
MPSSEPSLRILHVLRAPVGGLFRHVLDLATEQAARGHEVGLIADSSTGGESAARQIAALAPQLKLGVMRSPMRRKPHVSDFVAIARVCREIARLKPDIVHGHGSKGGLYARASGFAPGLGAPLRVYTPHGGSFHHQPGHALYMAVEWIVASQTDLLLFESDFMAREYARDVGPTRAIRLTAKNGLRPEEFAPVPAGPDAAEFLYIGELSPYKGVDTLIEALAAIHAEGREKPRLAIVGRGGEHERLAAMAEHHGLNRAIAFHGALPAREAFSLGRVVVAPSRAESLPYIVMEAIASDKTIVATDVGGVGEIFGPLRYRLVPRDDPAALAQAMTTALRCDPDKAAAERAMLSRHVASHFSVKTMVDMALCGYRQGLSRRRDRPAALSSATS